MTGQIAGQLNLSDLLAESNFLASLPQFAECDDCWCYDCQYNANNEALPRDFAGVMKPCPACDSCLESGSAEVCVIGSYENGCKVRAIAEGYIP